MLRVRECFATGQCHRVCRATQPERRNRLKIFELEVRLTALAAAIKAQQRWTDGDSREPLAG